MSNVNRKHLAHRLFAVATLAGGLVFAPTVTWAQSMGEYANIIGVVTDSTQAVIPNATVILTSPALQVPQMTTTTDSAGGYKFVMLPAPGTYKLVFGAPGFHTVVKQGITLTVGFTAKVDSVMPVGNATTQVVVTSAGPVINTVSTAVTSTLQGETLSQVPKPMGMQDLLSMAAGVTLGGGSPDVGDSDLAIALKVETDAIGVSGDVADILMPELRIEGLNTLTEHAANGRVYLDSMAVGEAELKTSGNNAEVGLPGVAQEAVMKTGSNTFHGDAQGDFERPSFQSNNITAAEAAPPNNLKFGNPLAGDAYYDYAADFGGRIIRNKLWFYGGLSKQLINEGQANYKGGPDATGCWTCADSPNALLLSDLPQYDGKLEYQLAHSTKVIFSELWGRKLLNNQSGSPTRPLPASQYELQPGKIWEVSVNSVISPRMVLVGEFGYAGYDVDYEPEPVSQIGQFGFSKGAEFSGSPSEEELTTKLYTGPYPTLFNDKPQNSYEMPITVTYIPANPRLGGHHQFTFGTDDYWQSAGSRLTHDNASGDYLLGFKNGKPDQITVYNFPIPTSISDMTNQAIYATDTWTFKQVALDLGLRWERYHAFNPAQSKPAGQFADLFPAQAFPAQDLLTWTDVVPRLGAAWNVGGRGKTVIKGFYGMFRDTPGNVFGNAYNSNAQVSSTYAWNGPCAPTAPSAPVEYQCDVTPDYLASLPSLTPISQSGGKSQILNTKLKQDYINEYDASVEREIGPNMGVTASYIFHGVYDNYPVDANGVDIGHDYNTPVQFTDVSTGAPVTLYTYASGTGKNENEQINTPSGRPDTYNTLMFSFAKRTSAKWSAAASFWDTKYHRWINGTANLYGDPNSWFYPVDTTWNWGFNANAYYNLPKGFALSSFLTMESGTPGQRTEVFGSTASLSQGSETVNMGPYGQYRGPVISNLSVKAAKIFAIGERCHVEGNVQVFNVLNSSAAVTTNYLTTTNPNKPTFGVISSLISPRVARLGLKFSF